MVRHASKGNEGLTLLQREEEWDSDQQADGTFAGQDSFHTAKDNRPSLQNIRDNRHRQGGDDVSTCYSSARNYNPNNNMSLGAMSGFRAKSLAMRFASSSRRASLRDLNSSRRSQFSSENTPLKGGEQVGSSIQEMGSIDFPDEKESIKSALKDIIFGKIVSLMLIFGPFAYLAHIQQWDAKWIFWLNFLVMIPLASILGEFTEEVALHTNQTIGGLVNATFGNAVEVVVAIQALLANEIRVVQASMIGSIFSNLLLVLGCCFFFGGLKYKEQSFNSTAATANMALLALSSIALVLPTPFAEYYEVQDEHVLVISRVAAIFLLSMYVQLLIFQLKTHAHLFEDTPPAAGGEENGEENGADDGEEEEKPRIPMSVALIGLLLTTLSITIFSDFLVGSIDEFCEGSNVSKTFVGLIILPIVGNAVEHITAVTVAMKDKMDLAMGGMLRWLYWDGPWEQNYTLNLVVISLCFLFLIFQSLSVRAHRFHCLWFP
jgi:Ca2+:H+ antiporter